jgi:hypothetical protein
MYPQDEYCSPIQLWIEEICKGACHLGHEYDVLVLLHDDFQPCFQGDSSSYVYNV